MPIYNHECYIPLDAKTIVWRYLDFDKFKSLLETKSLFFCRADKFSDPFEGSIPRQEAEYRINTYKHLSQSFEHGYDEQQALKNISGMQATHQKYKKGIVVNCWHINKSESDAMWRLYLKSNEGVAIQSTKELIETTMANAVEEISLSKVRYLDYDKDFWHHKVDFPVTNYNLITPFVHKRTEFTHEQEFRMFMRIQEAIRDEKYWDNEAIEKGKLVKIDLLTLIENVYFPPTIDEKTKNRIISLSEKLGFKFNYLESKLSSKPYY